MSRRVSVGAFSAVLLNEAVAGGAGSAKTPHFFVPWPNLADWHCVASQDRTLDSAAERVDLDLIGPNRT